MKTTKTIIDAHVILRYLLNDSPEMSATARNMVQSGTATFPEVVAEVVYVLLKVYKASWEDIAAYIQTVLDDVEVERKDIMLRAAVLFGESSLDFVDCILLAHHDVENANVFSFDKKLNRRIARQ